MLKKHFMAGLLIWIPILVTIFVVKFVLTFLDNIVTSLPEAYQPANLFNIHILGFDVFIALLIIFLTGLLLTNIFGNKMIVAIENLLQKIPLVRSLYSGTKQILVTLVSSNGKSFRKVVLLQYPEEGIWSMGFLAGPAHSEVIKKCGEPMLSVFIPTTPNPTSGFLVMVPADAVIELNIPIEEGLKFIISLGTLNTPKN